MQQRRTFLKGAAAIGAGAAGFASSLFAAGADLPAATELGSTQRRYWCSTLERIATPVLECLARRELRTSMPVETAGSAEKLKKYTHLEAIARLLVGIGPWLGAERVAKSENALQAKFRKLASECMDAATDPKSPDFMNFSEGQQPLVDTAFLAQAILRAPFVLWEPLDSRVRKQVANALQASRVIPPINNNHILFSAVIETALLSMGERTVEERLENYLRKMLDWYRGDGLYADGEYFRFDYYNSFVIHPTLLDIFGFLRRRDSRFDEPFRIILRRAQRYAEIQERLIAPDATFPSIGRSITYRFGAFQLLGQIALMHELPDQISPPQARCAMTAVMRTMMEAPGTFDEKGWLRIGFCGHQVALGETYISTGSLYLCSVGLLPLALPPSDPFWSNPPARWTSQKLWSGESFPADRALRDDKTIAVPNLKR